MLSVSGNLPVVYWIDRTNTIVRVNEAWDLFAEANNASPAICSNAVLGRNLLDFVVGSETLRHVQILFGLARIKPGADVHFYRCDSPTTKRFMKLVMVPEGNGTLRIENWILRTEPIEDPAEFRFDPAAPDALSRCSDCNGVRYEDRWQNIESWDDHPRLGTDQAIPVIYDICPACAL